MPTKKFGDNAPPARIKERIRDWLSRQGYPLEFRTAAEFGKAGFRVRQGEYVSDTISGKLREIDVLADAARQEIDQPVQICYIVECKWTQEKPWVIFTSTGEEMPGVTISQAIASELGRLLLWAAGGDSRLNSTRTFGGSNRHGFGGRQAFSDGADPVFSALQSVVSLAKAKADEWNKRLDYEQSLNQNLLPRVGVILLPIIVIDGRLFEARLEGSDLLLEEVRSCRVHWRGSEAWEHMATVDIVTTNYLGEFVSCRAYEANIICKALKTYYDSLRSSCEHLDLGEFEIAEGGWGFPPPLLNRLSEALEVRRGVIPPRKK
jgi:hypothetical protein